MSNLNPDQFGNGLAGAGYEVRIDRTQPTTPAMRVRKDGRAVGQLSWRDDEYTPRGEIHFVDVRPEYRRQGIAAQMLKEAREIEPALHHSSHLSALGKKFAAGTPLA